MAKADLIISGKRYTLACAPGQEARLQELGARFDHVGHATVATAKVQNALAGHVAHQFGAAAIHLINSRRDQAGPSIE